MPCLIYAGSIGLPHYKGPSKGGSINGNGEGVYTISFSDGKLELNALNYIDNAGTLCLSKDKKTLYVASESRDSFGLKGNGGSLTALHVDEKGGLSLINASLSYGSRPAYVTLSDDDRYLLVSNHGSHSSTVISYEPDEKGGYRLKKGFDDSSLAVFEIKSDGAIGDLCDLKVFDHHGYWIHGQGQSTSHLHSVRYKNGLVFGPNRGADEIEVCCLKDDGRLEVLEMYKTKKGYAPRYLEFHPVLDIIYVLNENYPLVSVYHVDYKTGHLEHLQTLSSAEDDYFLHHDSPDDLEGEEAELGKRCPVFDRSVDAIMPSDLHVDKKGRYLYFANRYFNKQAFITIFSIDDDGLLHKVGIEPLDGKDPRGFGLIDDQTIAIGLMDKSVLVVYGLGDDGMFKRKIDEIAVPSISSLVVLT